MTNSRPPRRPYPPPPWKSRGALWVGLLPVKEPLAVPPDLWPVGSRTRLALALIHHREGTLAHDELILGPLVRDRHRVGIWIEHNWVNDEASLRGGHDIWQLPKVMARFTWSSAPGTTGADVRIEDGSGIVAHVRVHRNGGLLPLPPLPLALTGFGGFDDERLFVMGRLRGRLARERVEVTRWSDRLPALDSPSEGSCLARPGVAVRRFTMTMPAPAFRRARW
jgi:hypothetical protein